MRTNSEEATSEGLIQLANVNNGWQAASGESNHLPSAVGVEEERVGSSASVGTADGNPTRIDVSASSNMHTEEEDVATFLATQLASQAAPQQTSSKFCVIHENKI